MATFWTTQEGWNHRAVQGKPNGALQPCPYSRVSSKWAEVLTRARPASLDLAQRPPGRMDSAGLQRGDHRLPVSLSRPCPSGFWFDISPSAQGEGKEERREEGTQGSGFPNPELLKADNLCFTKRSLILPMAGGGAGGGRSTRTNK